jgi:hypothetical protein
MLTPCSGLRLETRTTEAFSWGSPSPPGSLRSGLRLEYHTIEAFSLGYPPDLRARFARAFVWNIIRFMPFPGGPP